MDTIFRLAHASFWFSGSVGKLIHKSVEKKTDEFERDEKSMNSSFRYLDTQSMTSRPSNDENHCKRARTKRVESKILEDGEERKERERECKK